MRYADAGTSKPISNIGLGTWQFGSREWGYGQEYEGRVGAIVARALQCGITLFDTAEIYGLGRSERLLGAALGDGRERAVVATKIFPLVPVSAVVQQRAVASAARLGVRRIDLYQIHQPNPVIRDGTTMAGMRTLQDVGLVDQVGVSNYSLSRWEAAERALGRPVLSNQVQYNLTQTGPEQDLLPYAAAKRRLVIAYSPLAQGFLSGRYDAAHPPSGPIRRMNPLFLPETSSAPRSCSRCCARSPPPTTSAPVRRRSPTCSTTRRSSRSPERRAWSRSRRTRRPPMSSLPTTSTPLCSPLPGPSSRWAGFGCCPTSSPPAAGPDPTPAIAPACAGSPGPGLRRLAEALESRAVGGDPAGTLGDEVVGAC